MSSDVSSRNLSSVEKNIETDGQQPPNPRVAYLKKLYLLLSLQFLIPAIVSYNLYFDDDSRRTMANNITILVLTSLILSTITVLQIGFWRTISAIPYSIIANVLFTVALTLFLVSISAARASLIPSMIFFSLFAASLALSIYAFTNKLELTYNGSSIYVLGAVIVVFQAYCMLSGEDFLSMIFVAASSAVWGLFLMLSTQTIFTGAKYNWASNEWVLGAVAVHTDMIRLVINCADLLRSLLLRNAYK